MSPGLIAGVVVLIAIAVLLAFVVRRGDSARRGAAMDEGAASLKLPISSTRLGPYKIVEMVAPGQFATTYRGCGPDGADVTIKLPTRSSLSDPDELKRFEREAQMLDTVHHPNVIRKIAEGRVDDQGRKVPYMVLEPMSGMDFGEFLAERAPVPVTDALKTLTQIASALDAIHAQSIVHRNLSPEAIRISPNGKVTLYNFGVARSATMDTITLHGQVVGTVEYIAPEQVAGKKVDARTDLYALGVLGYRLLTGKSPFVYANIAALVKQKGELEGPHARKLNEQVPPELDRLLSQLMSADPNRRPGPASAIQRELERIS